MQKPRAGQLAFERDIELHRTSAFLTRRQYGKTTNASRISLKKMMKKAGHTVVFGSVKLDLGREIVRKEAEQISNAFRSLMEAASKAKMSLNLYNASTQKELIVADGLEVPGLEKPKIISFDDLAELYEAQRLEFRLWHSRTLYSRTKVVALTPEAVGETGDLILDEVGRVKNFRAVWEAVRPIIMSNPLFRCFLTTTPPPDDTHFSFELLSPPVGWDPAPVPAGNTYRSELGVFVRRVTAFDADCDGVPIFDDDTGAIVSPAVSRQRDHDKDAWDRNYGVKFVAGGTGAVSLLMLDNAQRRGAPGGELRCEFFQIESDSDMDFACDWIKSNLRDGRIGLGWDLATTEKASSNPSSFTVMEEVGAEYAARAKLIWKTNDPKIAMERVWRLVSAVKSRPKGGRARRMCVDATNERYFASQVRDDLRGEIPVELVVASETIEIPGRPPQSMKQFLGSRLVEVIDDNHLALPAERYVREDYRLVRKERGAFTCEPDAQGRHGDTFDSDKLALHALGSERGRTILPPQPSKAILETMQGGSL